MQSNCLDTPLSSLLWLDFPGIFPYPIKHLRAFNTLIVYVNIALYDAGTCTVWTLAFLSKRGSIIVYPRAEVLDKRCSIAGR